MGVGLAADPFKGLVREALPWRDMEFAQKKFFACCLLHVRKDSRHLVRRPFLSLFFLSVLRVRSWKGIAYLTTASYPGVSKVSEKKLKEEAFE